MDDDWTEEEIEDFERWERKLRSSCRKLVACAVSKLVELSGRKE